MIYEKARNDALLLINDIDDENTKILRLTTSIDTIIKKSKIGNFRTSGLKAVNFTYGEVLFPDFCKVLLIVFDSITRNKYEKKVTMNNSVYHDYNFL